MKFDELNYWPDVVVACTQHNSTVISIHSPEANYAAAGTLSRKAHLNISSSFCTGKESRQQDSCVDRSARNERALAVGGQLYVQLRKLVSEWESQLQKHC